MILDLLQSHTLTGLNIKAGLSLPTTTVISVVDRQIPCFWKSSSMHVGKAFFMTDDDECAAFADGGSAKGRR